MRLSWIPDNAEYIWTLITSHIWLSWPPIVLAGLIALPLGYLAAARPKLRSLILAGSGILYAIPSLAVFVLLPPLIGTSILAPINVVIALTLYGLALQVRSTTDAFLHLPPEPIAAANAMGYPRLRRILTVDLPLAAPVMLAGLRVVSASTISLVSIGAIIGVPSLGSLFTDGFNRSFPTEIITGVLATVLLAIAFDLILQLIGFICLPWTRRKGA
ncbi:ABC transporter permease [Corynebacterium aquilae]|uniref:ABC transporter permease n=1 Tax=Corynebacterium aquilae DSM 44791 TaxID=1431546 RepID=A0A1L7CI82_9CORY|nr:ABC transporter permease [Corynebacterium aquilae]APT85572.1 ABC transporter permease [Corynebacterium aquilae DSM 44791]